MGVGDGNSDGDGDGEMDAEGEGDGDGAVGTDTLGASVELIGVLNVASLDSTVVGRKKDVSKEVSRGSGMASDWAEGDARRTDES